MIKIMMGQIDNFQAEYGILFKEALKMA